MKLSARLIEAFLALDETRRFVVAAERCHVSPSAFSQMIARLEREVGARLFDRNTRQVALTAEGEAFAVGARRIAAEIAASIGEIADRAAFRSGRVTVATPASLSADWMPAQLAAFRTAHPSLVLKLRDVVTDRCLDLVQAGQADLAIVGLPGNALEFESLSCFDERFFVLCRRDDPLAAGARVSLRQLRGRAFIRTSSVWRQLQPELLRAQVRDTGLEVEQFGTVAGLVLHGFGISLVPASALSLCRRPGLLARPVADRAVVRPLYLVRLRGRTPSAAAAALWRQLSGAIAAPLSGARRAGRRPAGSGR